MRILSLWVNKLCQNKIVRRRWREVCREERGNVMLLVAMGMVVFCGFCAMTADLGALYVMRQNAQSGADAAALAGADDLLKSADTAGTTAYNMAKTNDSACNYTVLADSTNGFVQVTGSQTVPLWFARVLGFNTATLHVKAKAQIGSLTSGLGMVPIAVQDQPFTYGQEVALSAGAGDGQSGNYGFLDFSGGGANDVDYYIKYGYDQTLSVGQSVPTKPGVMSGPVEDAINYRLSEDTSPSSNSYTTVRPDSPRVLYMPVVDSLDVNGKKPVTIVGFAAFYLEGLSGDGGNQQIMGRFLQMIRPGTLGPGTSYGTYGEKLVQ